MVGIPNFGIAYKLSSDDDTEVGAPADGPLTTGMHANQTGVLSYSEVYYK